MFTNTYLPHVGGVARSVVSFTRDLRKMGHSVLVVAPVYAGAGYQDDPSEEVLRVPAIQHFNGSDFSVRIPIPFLIDEKIDRFQPEIIHSHHPYLLGDAALRAARRRCLPLVFTHHTLYEKYTHYVSPDSEMMKKFAVHLSTEYANLCTRVIAPSRSIARLLASRGVATPTVEIPTGVDTRFFATGRGDRFRQEHSIPAHAFVIGHLGRLAPEKNLDYLARAVSDALTDLADARFLVVGEGVCAAGIRQIFRQKGMENRLTAAGNQTGRPLADAYHAMDLFVFSSHSETQGMVLAEAMASGLPVVALDAPGAREVVANTQNGLLLPADASEETFSQAVQALARKPETLLRMRERALVTAQSFAREKCATRLEALYQELVRAAGVNVCRDMDAWERLLAAIQAEWDLLSEKTKAVIETLADRSDGDGLAD